MVNSLCASGGGGRPAAAIQLAVERQKRNKLSTLFLKKLRTTSYGRPDERKPPGLGFAAGPLSSRFGIARV